MTSFRVRLALWNIAVLALVLAGFTLGMSLVLQNRVAAAIDADLAERGRMAAGRPPVPGLPGPPGGLGAGWGEGGPPGRRMPGGRRAGPLPGSEADGAPRPTADERAWREFLRADPRFELRRPRFFQLDGSPLFPWTGDTPLDPEGLATVADGRERFSTIRLDDERIRVFSTPLYFQGRPAGMCQTAQSLAEQSRLGAGLVRTVLLLSPLALLVAGLGGLFLAERALGPIRRLTTMAAGVQAEGLDARLKEQGTDELGRLAGTFNAMLARLQSAFQRMEATIEQQRRFTADASHELRTPLTVIKANAGLALSMPRSAESYRETLETIDRAATSMTRTVQDLLLLVRSDAGRLALQWEQIDTGELLRRSVAAVPGTHTVEIRIAAEATRLRGDGEQLQRLLCNLVENARRHTPADGRITVGADPAAEGIRLFVDDTGEGIPPEHLPHVCERFYRADPARARPGPGGTGLGLSICRAIAEAHGGRLEIASRPGEGTLVSVTVPHSPG